MGRFSVCYITWFKYGILSCTIIIHYGKYSYKYVPLGVATYPENFQQNMNGLFHGFEFIHAKIYDLLILTKGYLTDHLHKLELMQNKLKEK